jgi:hypothetical protein
MLEKDRTYVLFIPPAWLIGGTVDKIVDGVVYLRDAVYLESVGAGESPVSTLAKETDPRRLRKIITSCYGMPDGVAIRLDGCLMAVPCAISLRPLALSQEVDAIRDAQ